MNSPKAWLVFNLVGTVLMVSSLIANGMNLGLNSIICILFLGWNLWNLYSIWVRPAWKNWLIKRRTAGHLAHLRAQVERDKLS